MWASTCLVTVCLLLSLLAAPLPVTGKALDARRRRGTTASAVPPTMIKTTTTTTTTTTAPTTMTSTSNSNAPTTAASPTTAAPTTTAPTAPTTTTAVTCPSGQYVNEQNNTCTSCPQGKYTQDPSKSSCKTCPDGKFLPFVGKSSCDECPLGQFYSCSASDPQQCNKQKNETLCHACEAGRYMSADTRKTDLFNCRGCQPGKSTRGNINAFNCSACLANKYASFQNSSTCNLCPKGKHNDGNNGFGAPACAPDASSATKTLLVVISSVLGVVCVSILVMFACNVHTKRRRQGRRGFNESLTQRLLNPTNGHGRGSRHRLGSGENGTEVEISAAERPYRSSLPGWGSGGGWTTNPTALTKMEPCKSLSTAVHLAPAHFVIEYSQLQLLELVGAGGSSRVHRGRFSGHEVAIKELVLTPHDSNMAPGAAQMYSWGLDDLKREAQSLGSLQHPNIVRFFGVSEHTDDIDGIQRFYIVTEFCQSDLQRFMCTPQGAGQLNPRLFAELALQVASALAFIHEHGIMHRDIKPANVLIDRIGKVPVAKLCDFGVSVAAHTKAAQAATYTMAQGTPAFMAPEMIGLEDFGSGDNLDLSYYWGSGSGDYCDPTGHFAKGLASSSGSPSPTSGSQTPTSPGEGDETRLSDGSSSTNSNRDSLEQRLSAKGSSPSPRNSDSPQTFRLSAGSAGSTCSDDINPPSDGTAHYSNKVDVYSFAVLLWSMWMGQRPFNAVRAGTQIQFMRMICKGARPPTSEDLFPSVLRELLLLAWHADAAERPTMKELCDTLRSEEFCTAMGAQQNQLENQQNEAELVDGTLVGEAQARARSSGSERTSA